MIILEGVIVFLLEMIFGVKMRGLFFLVWMLLGGGYDCEWVLFVFYIGMYIWVVIRIDGEVGMIYKVDI